MAMKPLFLTHTFCVGACERHSAFRYPSKNITLLLASHEGAANFVLCSMKCVRRPFNRADRDSLGASVNAS